MDILQEHEPTCAKKLKEVMKVRHQSGGFEFIPPSTSSQSDPEFRVPLPPALMVVSSNPHANFFPQIALITFYAKFRSNSVQKIINCGVSHIFRT